MKLEIAAVVALLASLVAGIAHADTVPAPHAIEITPGTYLVCGASHENAIGGHNADCKVVRVAASVKVSR
jgi:hypothetical protein